MSLQSPKPYRTRLRPCLQQPLASDSYHDYSGVWGFLPTDTPWPYSSSVCGYIRHIYSLNDGISPYQNDGFQERGTKGVRFNGEIE